MVSHDEPSAEGRGHEPKHIYIRPRGMLGDGGMGRMRRAVSAAGLMLAIAGCFGESAEQLMKTAEFEELQRNHEHARELYQRIARDFPDSPEAKIAAERLAKPEPPPAP